MVVPTPTNPSSEAEPTVKLKGGGEVPIPIYWPGGVIPVVTTTASKTDIYSFKIFDGDNPTSVGLYGVIGGQNYG